MNAEQIRWWMEVLRRNVYVQLVFAATFVGVSGVTFMFSTGAAKRIGFLFGLAGFLIGIASCYLSGTMYDRLNSKLRAAEAIERKEKKKEEKHARKPKTDKTDGT